MAVVAAVCVSSEKGTPKENVHSAFVIADFGIQGDAHAGKWHRQVSLLSLQCIEAFQAGGVHVDFGAFGENLVISGYDLKDFPVGTKFCCGDVVLELTQIGKSCHHDCAIRKATGDCIMPREGVFCRVEKGGFIKEGDTFYIDNEEVQ